MKIEHFNELRNADNFLSTYINNISENNKNFLISGGTSFLEVLKKLSLKQNKFNFHLSDDRDVKNGSPDSNLFSYNCLKYKNINFKGFVPEKDFKKTINDYEKKLPKNYFDLSLLGVGDDGHIASIFPNKCNFFYKSSNSFYCESDYHKHNRFSLNLDYILKSKNIILYFRGDNKIKAYNNYFNNNFYPLNRLIDHKKKLIIVTAGKA
jgi:6-phosphogluconolactonase